MGANPNPRSISFPNSEAAEAGAAYARTVNGVLKAWNEDIYLVVEYDPAIFDGEDFGGTLFTALKAAHPEPEWWAYRGETAVFRQVFHALLKATGDDDNG